MPKLPKFNNVYVPKDVEFVNDELKSIPNSEFPKGEQVKVNLTFATLAQKGEYMQSFLETGKKKTGSSKIKTEHNYDQALKKHVLKIENLFGSNDKPIKNGLELSKDNHPGLNDLKQDLFYRICGIRFDENDDDDGSGELSQGEN